MSGERISRGLSDISDVLLESAMGAYERKQRHRCIWVRVLAGAAVIALLITAALWPPEEDGYITGPGLLTVRTYAVDENGDLVTESENLEEGVKFMPKVVYDPTTGCQGQFPFTFSVEENLYPGMDITLQISTDAGIFYKNEPYDPNSPIFLPNTPAIIQLFLQYYGQDFRVDIDKTLIWEPDGFDYVYMQEQIENGNLDYDSAHKDHDFVKNPSFIDVIVRADEYIIGYCVIEIREVNDATGNLAREFSFEVLTIISFPQVDGKWQSVTQEYVQQQIDRLHQEREQI